MSPDPPGVYQYLAWFVTVLSPAHPRFRLLHLASDGTSRPLRTDTHAWMANPTPSPSGDRRALSTMRLRSDLYRVEMPPL